jgi:hypothetical protein
MSWACRPIDLDPAKWVGHAAQSIWILQNELGVMKMSKWTQPLYCGHDSNTGGKMGCFVEMLICYGGFYIFKLTFENLYSVFNLWIGICKDATLT